MSLFAAWTTLSLVAARMEPAPAASARAPEPRPFRLAYNPLAALPATPVAAAGRRLPVPCEAERSRPILPA